MSRPKRALERAKFLQRLEVLRYSDDPGDIREIAHEFASHIELVDLFAQEGSNGRYVTRGGEPLPKLDIEAARARKLDRDGRFY